MERDEKKKTVGNSRDFRALFVFVVLFPTLRLLLTQAELSCNPRSRRFFILPCFAEQVITLESMQLTGGEENLYSAALYWLLFISRRVLHPFSFF